NRRGRPLALTAGTAILPSEIRDRGSRIVDRGSKIIHYPQSSILNPQSSILNPQSSILNLFTHDPSTRDP
ncbi:MAG: hypothetical protein NTV46_02650, partial [Verrucomicrobia bacterium]|nr:hypothetical protein [Verrucomicrobiota bacterium]